MRRKVNIFDLSEWDELVEETYGKIYSLQQQDGCVDRGIRYFKVPLHLTYVFDYENDTVPETLETDKIGVSFKAWLARDPKQLLSEVEIQSSNTLILWWYRNFYPELSMIVQDLYSRGLLPEGEYGINIDW